MSTPSSKGKIVFTGGGSGGHTVTALSVIDALKSRHPSTDSRIVFFGGKRGMEGEKNSVSVEQRMTSERGVPFVGIRSGKLQRRCSLSTIVGLFGVIGGVIDAWKFFGKNQVQFVFSTGGYVTVPVCFVAWLRHIPVIIHEQTTRVGLANKIASLFAMRILVGFTAAEAFFPKKKTMFVGNTVRCELLDKRLWPRSLTAKLRRFQAASDKYPIVLIAGGGQGSHLLNSIVQSALKSLASHFHVVVLTGSNQVFRDYDRLLQQRRKLAPEQQRRVIIEQHATSSEMGAYFDAADVFLGRSGAMFVYEIGVLGVPAVLVPIPWVTHNEQYHNAKVLESIGLAKILPEGVLSPEILFQEVQRMSMKVKTGMIAVDEEARRSIFVTDAAERIVVELERMDIL
ncbi:MAG: UDP-N-acetylglucosamine--N-acetylmuramyl-(pentapeptide) pyrophosphoryl-undecaprenol N-acetylglucosamine transferase [Candidatus Dojkabacteria bacterium]|nr:UDP-N-acetylglucosamine--N-acetylmuramyl-(pentapeptide) pyrophosphoryl-undecaprenol N-acetylglucosamine transferase [Candidatus Dojkabacteria bacterium]